jgi:hypothetical protein
MNKFNSRVHIEEKLRKVLFLSLLSKGETEIFSFLKTDGEGKFL